jgi:glyoxylase-like metal-dependent hydrolase (beta-lactamase superfamily II)
MADHAHDKGEPISVGLRDLADPGERYGRRWRVGDVTITKIVEHEVTGELERTLAKANREDLLAVPWLQPYFLTPEGLGITSIHALVIEAPGRRILVDTCIGNDKDREAMVPIFQCLQGPFLGDLASAGFAREDVDTVVCTHLHFDHVGWNTMLVDGRWRPTFPNARYLMHETEYRHWQQYARAREESAWGEVQSTSFIDSIKPVFDAGLVDLVGAPHQVCEEVALFPTPGHSPGHVSVRIRSRGEDAVITGDVSHHPCQLAYPDWGSLVDFDPDAATRARMDLFAQCSDQPILVIGTHWAGVTAGRIVAENGGFRLEI